MTYSAGVVSSDKKTQRIPKRVRIPDVAVVVLFGLLLALLVVVGHLLVIALLVALCLSLCVAPFRIHAMKCSSKKRPSASAKLSTSSGSSWPSCARN